MRISMFETLCATVLASCYFTGWLVAGRVLCVWTRACDLLVLLKVRVAERRCLIFCSGACRLCACCLVSISFRSDLFFI